MGNGIWIGFGLTLYLFTKFKRVFGKSCYFWGQVVKYEIDYGDVDYCFVVGCLLFVVFV